MTKWPYHADGETVRDFAGDFVAAAESESTARFLAAVPVLYLYYKAVETVQDNRIATLREEVQKALANWTPS